MKYLIPVLLALSLGWNYGTNRLLAADPVGSFRPTITALKDGEVEDRLQYRAKDFETREACEDFVKAGGDEDFRKSTVQALALLSQRGDDEAHLTCEETFKKPSI